MPESAIRRAAPDATSSVRSVSMLTTGTVDLHAEHILGSRWPSLAWIFFGRRVDRVPISVFLIGHDEGWLLFDTGVHPGLTTDPDYWPDPVTRFIMGKIFRFQVGPADRLRSRLTEAGVDPGAITKAVISHLHFDHVGGIADIPEAELLVSREAWQHMLGDHPEREGVLRRDIEIPEARWTEVDLPPTDDASLAPFDRAHDVMGDGSIMLLPTPGHLPGSLSMLVRADPPVLFVADLCYSLEGLLEDRFPGTGDHAALARSFAKVRELRSRMPGLLLVPSHDPSAVATLRTHPLWREGPGSD